MRYRVFNDQTDQTLFTSDDPFECMSYMDNTISDDSLDYERVWLEKLGGNEDD